MNGIIRTSNLIDVVPAMVAHPGTRPLHIGGAVMFDILSQKRCNKCGEWKRKDNFYKDSTRLDGLQYVCKSCHNKRTSAWGENNPDRRRETRTNWRAAHLEQAKEAGRKCYQAHAEQRREYRRIKYYENIENEKAQKRAWAKANPEQVRARVRNRRALKRGCGGTITAQEWKSLKVQYGNECVFPGCSRTDLTIDHIIPLSKGGANTIDNAQPLCVSHNASKGAKTIDYRK